MMSLGLNLDLVTFRALHLGLTRINRGCEALLQSPSRIQVQRCTWIFGPLYVFSTTYAANPSANVLFLPGFAANEWQYLHLDSIPNQLPITHYGSAA